MTSRFSESLNDRSWSVNNCNTVQQEYFFFFTDRKLKLFSKIETKCNTSVRVVLCRFQQIIIFRPWCKMKFYNCLKIMYFHRKLVAKWEKDLKRKWRKMLKICIFHSKFSTFLQKCQCISIEVTYNVYAAIWFRFTFTNHFILVYQMLNKQELWAFSDHGLNSDFRLKIHFFIILLYSNRFNLIVFCDQFYMEIVLWKYIHIMFRQSQNFISCRETKWPPLNFKCAQKFKRMPN